MSTKLLSDAKEIQLLDIVSKNLKGLIDALGVSQKKFAEMTGISSAALSKYLKGNEAAEPGLPSFDYMVGLTMMQEFKDIGLKLTLDLLISEKFDPVAIVNKKQGQTVSLHRELKHSDFFGNYQCYFYDQSATIYSQDHKLNRELRYGVISVYNDVETLTGGERVRAIAAFFKEGNVELANLLKRQLDSIFKSDAPLKSRNEAIEQAFRAEHIYAYEGIVTFTDRHTFINIQSNIHGDNALIILYSPQKKVDTDYIGGIGCVSSVGRGSTHMPTFHKIIVSKYKLDCSRDVIAEHLNMSQVKITQAEEAQAITEFCRKLYSDPEYGSLFDEEDKALLIQRRMEQLVKIYLEKNICCVGTVTEDEDKAVYKLIEQYKE